MDIQTALELQLFIWHWSKRETGIKWSRDKV